MPAPFFYYRGISGQGHKFGMGSISLGQGREEYVLCMKAVEATFIVLVAIDCVRGVARVTICTCDHCYESCNNQVE